MYISFVKEADIILDYLNAILVYTKAVTEGDQATINNGKLKTPTEVYDVKNRVIYILKKYQEQGSLLDKILDKLVVPIMD